MFALLTQVALGQTPDFPDVVAEEVFVYADPLSAWNNTRWVLVSEHVTPSGMSLRSPDFDLHAPSWQVEAIVFCTVEDWRNQGGVVSCAVEDMALRASTVDLWQRPSDLEDVKDLLHYVAQSQVGKSVRLRVKDHGDVRVIEGGDRESSQTNALLGDLFDAFHLDLPSGGFVSGEHWGSTDEPLLALGEGFESFGLREVVHYGNTTGGTQIIQTIGASSKRTVVGERYAGGSVNERFQASYRVPIPGEKKLPVEIIVESSVHLDAVAVLDRDKGFVTERVWGARGERVNFWRAGRLRLLGEAETVKLGETGQVGRPHTTHQSTVPRWAPVDPELR